MIELVLGTLIIGYLVIALRSNHFDFLSKQKQAEKTSLHVAVMRINEHSVYEDHNEVEDVVVDEGYRIKKRDSGERPSAVLRRMQLLAEAKEKGIDVSELEPQEL